MEYEQREQAAEQRERKQREKAEQRESEQRTKEIARVLRAEQENRERAAEKFGAHTNNVFCKLPSSSANARLQIRPLALKTPD